ncbi:MAG: hypothetical protein R3C20_00355 [Planctomycetaceae bacterium]
MLPEYIWHALRQQPTQSDVVFPDGDDYFYSLIEQISPNNSDLVR